MHDTEIYSFNPNYDRYLLTLPFVNVINPFEMPNANETVILIKPFLFVTSSVGLEMPEELLVDIHWLKLTGSA